MRGIIILNGINFLFSLTNEQSLDGDRRQNDQHRHHHSHFVHHRHQHELDSLMTERSTLSSRPF